MRKHATSWLIKVALFAIVIVFIFWGGYSYTEKKASRIATVDGSYIGIMEYQNAYSNLLEQMRRQYGQQFSSQMAEAFNLKEQALNQLINRRVLLAQAHQLELTVSREELQQAIVAYPAFQTNGRFDPVRYQQTLQYMRLTPQEFEASQHEDLLINKLAFFITRGVKVLPEEVLAYFHYTQDKVNLAYLQIEPEEFIDQVKVDEEALKDYFQEHREEYRLEAKRNVVFVRFSPQDYLQEVDPSEAEVEDYYRLNPDNYREPPKVRARHILFRLPEKPSPAKTQVVREKALEVLALARKGDDFAILAEKYSEGPTAPKGGDLGYFTRTDMVEPFSDAAFSMKKGEISDLVQTRFGFHIIKVEDIQEDSIKPLEEVKEDIIRSLQEEGARDIVRQKAQSFADKARALDDLAQAAVDMGLKSTESGFFAANESIPQLERQDDLADVFFSMQIKEITPALGLEDGEVVAQLLEIQDARLPEFAEVKEEVTADWIAAQSKVLARKQAEEWLTEARQRGNLEELARDNNLELKETGLFAALSPVPPLSGQPDLVVTAFALTEEQPVVPEVSEVSDNFYLFQLKERRPASEEEFQEAKNNLADNLLQVKRDEALKRWVEARRQQSDVKILQEL
jgi:peptidyl-prolyl cis-trans isomerase D